jgi:hypothetical protein
MEDSTQGIRSGEHARSISPSPRRAIQSLECPVPGPRQQGVAPSRKGHECATHRTADYRMRHGESKGKTRHAPRVCVRAGG